MAWKRKTLLKSYAYIFFILFFICMLFLGFIISLILPIAISVSKPAEIFAGDISSIIQKYDAGKPFIYEFKEDELIEENYSYMISIDQFTKATNVKTKTAGNEITLYNATDSITIKANDNIARVNDENTIMLRQAVVNQSQKLYFPIADIAESLGYQVETTDAAIRLTRPYQSKRLIVKSDIDLPRQDAIAWAEVYDGLNIYQYITEEEAEKACDYYDNLPGVLWAEPDGYVTTQADESDNSYDFMSTAADSSFLSWGADAMGVGNYRNYLSSLVSTDIRDTVVAVLDTGIDTEHSMFSGRIANGGRNFSPTPDKSVAYQDGHRHGTHVSGIICDLTPSNVKILPIKVLGDEGYGYDSGIIAGIKYIIEQKQTLNICAMNMSFGGFDPKQELFSMYDEIITEAYGKGILSVVSAGNDYMNAATFSPASIPKAITVSAVGMFGNNYYTKPSWSNWGNVIDIAAPGVDIVSAKLGGGNISLSGTSMAAPHVAGAIALIVSDKTKSYSLPETEELLYVFATVAGGGEDYFYGHGMVNVEYIYGKIIDPVTFSNTSQEVDAPFYLTLSHPDPDAIIFYTTNNSKPTLSSSKYTSPIYIDKTMTVKTVAFVFDKDNNILGCGKISTAIYYLFGRDVENAFSVNSAGRITAYRGILADISVPSVINGITVTSIGPNAFEYKNIKTVTLAATIKYIYSFAFQYCYNLETVYAPGVTEIYTGAFRFCTSLKLVNDMHFPKLEKIGVSGFYWCYGLTEISLSNVIMIDEGAFDMNMADGEPTGITEVNLPNALCLNNAAFIGCTYLRTINIPEVKFLYAGVFSECGFIDIYLPNLIYMSYNVFRDNKNLKNVDLPNATVLGGHNFSSCSQLQTAKLPKVQVIGMSEFYDCYNLTNIEAPQVLEISDYAFEKCSSLTEFTANKLRKIGDQAFNENKRLSTVEIPSVVSIGKWAFGNCTALKQLVLSSNLTSIGISAFSGINNNCVIDLYKGTFADSYFSTYMWKVRFISSGYSFDYLTVNSEIYITGVKGSGSELVIPSSIDGLPVTKIKADAFKNNSNLFSLDLLYVQEIEEGAFANCINLKQVYLPQLKAVGISAFMGCISLNSVYIPEAINVGDFAFNGCRSLLSIELGNDIRVLGEKSFGYNGNEIISIFKIYGNGSTIASLYSNDNNIIFNSIYADLTYGIGNAIIDGKEYNAFVNSELLTNGRLMLPGSINGEPIRVIASTAFLARDFIREIVLPSSIFMIDYAAFYRCSLLEKINLENVTYIGDQAFDAADLREVYLPNIRHIGRYAFDKNWNLKSIYIGKYVETIEWIDSPGSGNNTIYKDVIIYGYAGTAAQEYATKNGNIFIQIDDFVIDKNISGTIKLQQNKEQYIVFGAKGAGLKYQWYENTIASSVGGTPIEGAVFSTYAPDTSKFGYTYFYVKVTDWNGGELISGVQTVEVVQHFTVIFTNWDGAILKTEFVRSGFSATAPTNPMRASDSQYNYFFSVWDNKFTDVTEDLIVTALFTRTAKIFTIEYSHYIVSSATILEKTLVNCAYVSEYSIETPLFSLPVPTFNGNTYIFAGWYSDTALTIKATQADTQITGGLKFYAKWLPDYLTNIILSDGDLTVSTHNGSTLPADAILIASPIESAKLQDNVLKGFEISVYSSIGKIDFNGKLLISFNISNYLAKYKDFEVYIDSANSGNILESYIENGRIYFLSATDGSFYLKADQRTNNLLITLYIGLPIIVIALTLFIIITIKKRKR